MGGYQRRKRTPVNVYGTRWDPLSHCNLARLSPRATNTAHKELGLYQLMYAWQRTYLSCGGSVP